MDSTGRLVSLRTPLFPNLLSQKKKRKWFRRPLPIPATDREVSVGGGAGTGRNWKEDYMVGLQCGRGSFPTWRQVVSGTFAWERDSLPVPQKEGQRVCPTTLKAVSRVERVQGHLKKDLGKTIVVGHVDCQNRGSTSTPSRTHSRHSCSPGVETWSTWSRRGVSTDSVPRPGLSSVQRRFYRRTLVCTLSARSPRRRRWEVPWFNLVMILHVSCLGYG